MELSLEHEPHLELNPARRVPLLRDLAEVRAVDVGIRRVPEHVIEGVDEVQAKLQRLPLCHREAAQEVGVELVPAMAAQPVERGREDAAMERIRLEVSRRHVRVRTRLVVARPADVAHLLKDRFRHDLADARFIRSAVRGAVIARGAGEELPIEPRVHRLIFRLFRDGAQVVTVIEPVPCAVDAAALLGVDAADLPAADQRPQPLVAREELPALAEREFVDEVGVQIVRRGGVRRRPDQEVVELVQARRAIEVRRPDVRCLKAVALRQPLGDRDFQVVVDLLTAGIAPFRQAVRLRVEPQQLRFADRRVGEEAVGAHIGVDHRV